MLIEWFDPEELQQVVGGEKWWQVRGLDGVEAEWVTERKFLKNDNDIRQSKRKPEEKLSPSSLDILRMDSLEKVMVSGHAFTCLKETVSLKSLTALCSRW